jgi:hypothetical protein
MTARYVLFVLLEEAPECKQEDYTEEDLFIGGLAFLLVLHYS